MIWQGYRRNTVNADGASKRLGKPSDGRRVAFVVGNGEPTRYEIWAMENFPGARRELYRTSKGLDIQKWTPDGGAVLVRESMGQPDQRALWLPAAGGEAQAEGPRPLPIGCKDDSIGADWDPTGERIAFLSGGVSSQAPARIIIQSRSGHIEREVAAPGRFAMFGRVRWSPDGTTLAVRSTGPEGADILTLVDLVTGEQREIARGSTWAREDGKIREIRWARHTLFPAGQQDSCL